MSEKFKIIDGEVYEKTQFSQGLYPYSKDVLYPHEETDWILENFFKTDKGKFVQERGMNVEAFCQTRPDTWLTEIAVWGYMKPQDHTLMVLKYENQNRKIA